MALSGPPGQPEQPDQQHDPGGTVGALLLETARGLVAVWAAESLDEARLEADLLYGEAAGLSRAQVIAAGRETPPPEARALRGAAAAAHGARAARLHPRTPRVPRPDLRGRSRRAHPAPGDGDARRGLAGGDPRAPQRPPHRARRRRRHGQRRGRAGDRAACARGEGLRDGRLDGGAALGGPQSRAAGADGARRAAREERCASGTKTIGNSSPFAPCTKDHAHQAGPARSCSRGRP